MPRQLVFTIPGHPKGKGRAKSSSRIGVDKKTGKPRVFTRHYTPKETATYENLVRLAAERALAGRAPFRGAIKLDVEAGFAVPASWSESRRQRALAGEIYPTVKPDRDNIEKSVSDGLNGLVFVDDCYIVDGSFRKRYAASPGLIVVVTELEGETAQGKKQ
ncbi:RusA family crossover junction endodeoxyribonuclease [Achromobacter aloeverae]